MAIAQRKNRTPSEEAADRPRPTTSAIIAHVRHALPTCGCLVCSLVRRCASNSEPPLLLRISGGEGGRKLILIQGSLRTGITLTLVQEEKLDLS